ncbi:MAG: IS66 family transposase [Deltaproteobacteria bacterium]|nr:MAG: IS66 family transposase [Deltaproteobacteria bacterium]
MVNAGLVEQLAKQEARMQGLLSRLYGRRSERSENPDQLFLYSEPDQPEIPVFVDEAPDEESGTADQQGPQKKKRRHRSGPRASKDLPVKETVIEIQEDDRLCPCCDQPMEAIGEAHSDKFNIVQACAEILRTVCIKYACKHCEDAGVRQASVPPSPIEGSKAGAGLLSHIVVSKYDDHLPLNRQERILKRHGLEIAQSTMVDWVRRVAELCSPIRDQMQREILDCKMIQTDDTKILVLDKSHPKGSKKAYLWVYLDMNKNAVFDFTTKRNRGSPEAWFGDYKGHIVADGFPGYDHLFKDGLCVEVGCWSHARRKFFDAAKAGDEKGQLAVDVIRGLFHIEKEMKEQGLKRDQRTAVRQKKSKPIADSLFKWLEGLNQSQDPSQLMGTAITYALNQKQALLEFLKDGDLPLHNNDSERAMRHVAVGRRNWTFAGSEAGGERAAILYSLMYSCRLVGICPQSYLADVLDKVSTHPAARVAELTPRGWAKARGLL